MGDLRLLEQRGSNSESSFTLGVGGEGRERQQAKEPESRGVGGDEGLLLL